MSDLLVLCYHAISDSWPATLAVTPDQLEGQLALLVGRGYRGTTFTDAVTRPMLGRRLVVTFDDGYRSVIERAFPILDRLGLPGTVFVPTGLIGAEGPMAWPGIDQWIGGPHEEELSGMSWAELRDLTGAGWEIGSHTRTHPWLNALDRPPLEAELRDSRRECEERLEVPCRSMAYPYGEVGSMVVERARAAGYEAACTLPQGRFARPDPLRWPRIGVYHDDRPWRFRLKVSRVMRAARELPAWDTVDRLRRAAPTI